MEISIQSLFLDICEQARNDGEVKFGYLSSIKRNILDPQRKPGKFYNQLPEHIKERIRKELKSEHAQDPLRSMMVYGDIVENGVNCHREILKFELELLKMDGNQIFLFARRMNN